MLRLLFVGMLSLACMPAAAGGCQSLIAAEVETAMEAQKLGGEVLTLKGHEAADYLDIVNSVPPLTHMAAEAIILLVVPNRGAVIGLVSGGTVCVAGRIGAAVHARALKKAQGEDT